MAISVVYNKPENVETTDARLIYNMIVDFITDKSKKNVSINCDTLGQAQYRIAVINRALPEIVGKRDLDKYSVRRFGKTVTIFKVYKNIVKEMSMKEVLNDNN